MRGIAASGLSVKVDDISRVVVPNYGAYRLDHLDLSLSVVVNVMAFAVWLRDICPGRNIVASSVDPSRPLDELKINVGQLQAQARGVEADLRAKIQALEREMENLRRGFICSETNAR
jgi:hypothetical protein